MRGAHINLPRRCVIVVASAAISAVLFRSQIGATIVSRGDEFLVRGDLAAATRFYERGLAFDQTSALAADRLAFAGFLMRTASALERATRAATAGLAVHPTDTDLLLDRALCYQVERRYAAAYADFMRVATLRRDARLYHFAAWSAYRSGNVRAARAAWRAALQADASFAPARLALARTRHAK